MKGTNVLKKIDLLDTSRDTQAFKTLGSLLKDKKKILPYFLHFAQETARPRVRKWCLEGLGFFRSQQAEQVLIEALDDQAMTVRLHALKALIQMRSKKSAPHIVKLLQDSSGGVQYHAIWGLVALKHKKSIPIIAKLLAHEKWYLRQQACLALGELGVKGFEAKLKKMSVDDPRKAVRLAASQCLGG